MDRPHPVSTRAYTLFPDTPRFRSDVRLVVYVPGGICAARNALSTNGPTMRIPSVRAGGVVISIGTSPLDQRSASTVTPAGARHATLPMAEASDALRTPFNSARSDRQSTRLNSSH